ncbi:hypothetical protein KR018_003405, partial [Drosophila ironensis]
LQIIFRKNRANKLLKSGALSDVCILVNDAKFPCHKFPLACASEFFEKLLQKDGLETGEVRLENTTPDVFEIVLNFIYTENSEPIGILSSEALVEVLQCSNMWMIFELEDICTRLLQEKLKDMNPNFLIELFEVFHGINNETMITTILRVNKAQLDCPSSLELEIDYFQKYLQLTSDCLPEYKRFAMVEKLIEKKQDPTNYLHLLKDIDYRKMSIQEFRDGPGISNLLSDKDKYEYISQIALGEN